MSKGGKGELEKKEAPPDTWWSVYVCRARNPGLRCAGCGVCVLCVSERGPAAVAEKRMTWHSVGSEPEKRNHTHAQFLNRSQLWDVWL